MVACPVYLQFLVLLLEGNQWGDKLSCVAQFWSGSSQRKRTPARLLVAILSNQPITAPAEPLPKYFWKISDLLPWTMTKTCQVELRGGEKKLTVLFSVLSHEYCFFETFSNLITLCCVAGRVNLINY